MALVTNFKNFFGKVTTADTPVTLLTCAVGNTWMLLGLDVCNKVNTGVLVSVSIYNSSNQSEYNLCKNTPIPAGSTLSIINKQKIVLEENDILKIEADTANSVDVIGSYMKMFTD